MTTRKGMIVDVFRTLVEIQNECVLLADAPMRVALECETLTDKSEVYNLRMESDNEKALLSIIRAVLNSEDDTGCSEDLTVVSKSAIARLREVQRG
jgi:hypothetical protein